MQIELRAFGSLLLGAMGFMASFSAFADEIDVAREALRDGLWEVARNHATRAGIGKLESRAVIAESFAREGKWKELLDEMASWEESSEDVLVYYRALALLETGKPAQAGYLVQGRKFSDPRYALLATRLKARVALAEGGASEALKVVKSADDALQDEDTALFAAGLLFATGDCAAATNIWREVVSRGTNASERAFTVASVNLGDAKLVKEAYDKSVSADMKRLAGYAHGKALLKDKSTLEEGVALVRSLVRDAPDAPGARDGLAAVASSYLAHHFAKESVAVYKEMFETWPDSVKSFDLQEGLGRSLCELKRFDEALEAFARAEECASDDEDRAMAMVEQGNMLGAAGKEDAKLAKLRNVLSKYPATAAAASIKDTVRLSDLEDKGRSLYGEYHFAEAQEIFREVAEKDASKKPLMEYLEVMCLYGQGLDDEAEKRAGEIAAKSPDVDMRARATLWLAKLSYNRGAWADARKRFADYAEIAPTAPDAPDALVWSARAAFAESDFSAAIQVVTGLVEAYPDSPARFRGFLVQGEALIELARFDEAVLVLERAALAEGTDPTDRLRAKMLGADALFAMGADNPLRYQEALEAYKSVSMGESLDSSQRLCVAYKIAKTLEKMKRTEEASDRYYTDVVIAYRNGRSNGVRYDDEARASFSRAAFRLADDFEARGRDYQAIHVLELVVASDVPAAAEAAKRIDRIRRKGNFL